MILKLHNDNESLTNNKTSKTTILIVVNEIISITFSNDVSSTNDVPAGFIYLFLFIIKYINVLNFFFFFFISCF